MAEPTTSQQVPGAIRALGRANAEIERLRAELAVARQRTDAALALHGVGESCDCEGGSCDHADWCPICVDGNGDQIRQVDDATVRALTGDGSSNG